MKNKFALISSLVLEIILFQSQALADVSYQVNRYRGCSIGYKIPEQQADLDTANENYYAIQDIENKIRQSSDDNEKINLLNTLNELVKREWQIYANRATDCQAFNRINIVVPDNPVTYTQGSAPTPSPTPDPDPTPEPDPSPSPDNSKSAQERLEKISIEAAKNNKDNCSGSVREAANKLGFDLSRKTVAEGLGVSAKERGNSANDQIDYMNSKWKTLTLEEAVQLAGEGKFVVAGLKATRNGHVAVVLPGGKTHPKTGSTIWPYLAGGALDSQHPGQPGRAYSEGDKTVRQVFPVKKLDQVKYFAPN